MKKSAVKKKKKMTAATAAAKDMASLRRKAEKKLLLDRERLKELSATDLKKLVHELGTHQIELEMQNEELRRTQVELEASRQRYADLYDLAPVGYVTLDASGVVVEANLTAGQMLGRTKSSLLKRQFQDFVKDPRDRKELFLHCAAVLSAQVKRTCEVAMRRADGTEFVARLESIVVAGREGMPIAIRTAISDVTDRKRVEEALLRERDLLQSVMNGARNSHLVYLDRDFNFVRVNAAYARTCGYRPEEMIGKNHFALYPDAGNEAIFRRVRDTGELFEVHDNPFEFPDQPGRGVTYWDWTLMPVKGPDGAVEGLVLSLHETTARRQAEEALRRSLQELEEANRDLARFNRAAVGREQKMIDLKKEVNVLCAAAGQPPRYPLEFEKGETASD